MNTVTCIAPCGTHTRVQSLDIVNDPFSLDVITDPLTRMMGNLSTKIEALPQGNATEEMEQEAPASTLANNDIAEQITFGPEEAAAFLKEYTYELQRSIRNKQVIFYANQMKAGTWVKDSVITCAILPDGTKILVDGYHRLTAVKKSGTAQRFIVICREAAGMNEVKRLYTTIDNGLTRTQRDLFKVIFAEKEAPMIDLAQRHMLSSALSCLVDGFRSNSARTQDKLTIYERADLTEVWEESAALYLLAVGQSDETRLCERLKAAVIMAVAVLTYQFAPNEADMFWTKIAINDGLPKASPEGRVVSFLREYTNDARGTNVQARYVAACWNAFIEGTSVKSAFDLDEFKAMKAPIVIANTCFDGKAYHHLTVEGDWVSDAVAMPKVAKEASVKPPRAAKGSARKKTNAPTAESTTPSGEEEVTITISEEAAPLVSCSVGATEVEEAVFIAAEPTTEVGETAVADQEEDAMNSLSEDNRNDFPSE